MTTNLPIRLVGSIRLVRLVVKGFEFRVIQKKILERTGAQHHAAAGNTGNEMDVIGPLTFVLDKPCGGLRRGNDQPQEEKATAQELKQKIPERNTHTTIVLQWP